jgi:glycine cleavage system H protein
MYPNDYRFTKDHEWLKVEGDEGVVGITDFAQKQLGDIIYVELPQVGTQMEVHQPIGDIDSVKMSAKVFSPVSGEIIAVNTKLAEQESTKLVNEDPHGEGWIARIKMKNRAEVENLMSASEYEKFLEGLEH